MKTQATCRARWYWHKQSRMQDLRKLWRAYCNGQEDVEDLGNLYEYGLSFDYVPPHTFTGQRQGYWRYQISWGGPSEEFRFYSSGPDYPPHRITFTFLDWFDGHERKLRGRDESLMLELWGWFEELGIIQAEYEKGGG